MLSNEVALLFEKFKVSSGFDFIYLRDQFEFSRMVDGLYVSFQLIFWCLSLSLVIGLLGVMAQETRYRAVRFFLRAYVEIFRNTPPYIQLLFFYFGVGSLLSSVAAHFGFRLEIDRLEWAIISLSLFGGALLTEILRSGIEAVPTTMHEAATALGYTHWQTFFVITLPLAFRVCLPALGGIMISLLKYTSLVYAIAVPDITYTSQLIWSENFNVLEMMITLFVFYNLSVSVLSVILHAVERKLALPGYR